MGVYFLVLGGYSMYICSGGAHGCSLGSLVYRLRIVVALSYGLSTHRTYKLELLYVAIELHESPLNREV